MSEYHEKDGVNLGGVRVISMLQANPIILPVVNFVWPEVEFKLQGKIYEGGAEIPGA